MEWLHELKQQLKGSRHEVGERPGDLLSMQELTREHQRLMEMEQQEQLREEPL